MSKIKSTPKELERFVAVPKGIDVKKPQHRSSLTNTHQRTTKSK